MHVVIGGASGFLGTALVAHLREQDHQVTRLVRTDDSSSDASLWDPRTGRLDQIVIDRADAVVNLSGSSVGRFPRTGRVRRELLASRIDATTTLARAVAASDNKPALLSGSAMGYYGPDRGDEILIESSEPGTGFLSELVQRWEQATQPAADAGARVCILRTTLPLDRRGGLLGPLVPMFKLGAGARLGTGRQYMAMVSLHDWLRAVTFLLEHPTASGPFNIGMPQPPTNAEFTDALGDALHRPTVLVAPTFVLRTVLGKVADDLLGSLRLDSLALREAGFTFDHHDVVEALESALR
ncbi:TIGR01777 family oxidoreductase [Aeromicrobium sp.]|uniref:TIGR01777 family oxidoreductase n=1 Tax=Aeromicrobium sp. TaxID=1871063 RepID=UPI003C4BB1ED